MKKLHISEDLSLPLDTVTSTLVVYGGKGMGKTNLASVLVEEIDANGLRFAFLDPVGVSWGLRHSVDGKGRGIEILILGGIHGDIPIEPTGGAVVADLVVDESVNVLIDISRRPDGSMWSIGERIRFVKDYCKRLYQRQGEKRRPIMQVIDEAARFAPQIVRKGDDDVAASMGAIAVLVEEGRNVGIGVTLLTLRSARLNKDVAELADCMIAFRTVGPNSRGAVLDWLGEHVDKERLKELDLTVRKLPVGSALVVSPGWLNFEGVVAFRARRTFDSSKTPKPGETVRASGPGAKPDLPKYQERMAETIERAKESDPKEWKKREAELKKKIADLERQVAKPAPAAKEKAVDPEKLKERAQKMADRAVSKALAPIYGKVRSMTARIAAMKAIHAKARDAEINDTAAIEKALEELNTQAIEVEKAGATIEIETPTPPQATGMARVTRSVGRTDRHFSNAQTSKAMSNATTSEAGHRPPASPSDGSLSKMGRAILTAFAQHPEGITKGQALVFADYRSSGNTATFFGVANEQGWIAPTPDGRYMIMRAGLDLLGQFEPLPTGAGLRKQVLESPKLSPLEKEMMRVAFDVYPDSIGKGALLGRADYKSSGNTATAFGKFITMQWLTQPRSGHVRASDTFFEEQ